MFTAAAFAVAGLSAGKTVLLGLCGLVGGIGITALGPGGVLFTIALFALSGLSPPAIAGTAIVANAGTGLLGTGAYARSGQLRGRDTQRLAGLLIACAAVGTPLGVLANSHISGPAFGTLLAVPLLVAAGTPMLAALGAAQAQPIVIAGVGTLGYVLRGDVSWPLAALVGVPALVGVVAGWRLAHALPADRLRLVLAGVLILVGVYLIVRNRRRSPRTPGSPPPITAVAHKRAGIRSPLSIAEDGPAEQGSLDSHNLDRI